MANVYNKLKNIYSSVDPDLVWKTLKELQE